MKLKNIKSTNTKGQVDTKINIYFSFGQRKVMTHNK